MPRLGIFSVLILTAFVSAACNRQDEAVISPAAEAGDGAELTVVGCLTTAPDRGAFVVTPAADALASSTLANSTGEVPTFTYELVGSVDLQAHVGRQVSVKGRLDDDRKDEVDVQTKDKVELPPTRSGNDTVTPAIETKEEIEIQVRRLHVTSVAPTGQPCQAAR